MSSRRTKSKLKVDDEVMFVGGNFDGLTAKVIATDYESKHQNAIFGYHHTVMLSNGNVGYIEKSEHWEYNTDVRHLHTSLTTGIVSNRILHT